MSRVVEVVCLLPDLREWTGSMTVAVCSSKLEDSILEDNELAVVVDRKTPWPAVVHFD